MKEQEQGKSDWSTKNTVKKSNTALDEKEPLAHLQFDTPKAWRPYKHSHSQGFKRVWLGRRRWWWGQSQCAIPNPRMVFLRVQESSSCGPPVSPLVWYTAPSTAHCSVAKGYSVTQCTSKYTCFSHRFGTCNKNKVNWVYNKLNWTVSL